MINNICLIDDQIPLSEDETVDEKKRMNASNLLVLLKDNINWSEPPLKELLSTLLSDENRWNVSAFSRPDFYLNCMEQENYKADFIIFDWDYNLGETPTDEFLKQIVESSFSIIIIFTASDKEETVREIIEKDFSLYKNRIELILKSDTNSSDKLIAKAKQLYEQNFAFKYSSKLRNATLSSLESILVELGKPNIDELILMFGDAKEGQCYLNTKDFTEIIVEKLRNELVSKKFGDNIISVNQGKAAKLNPDVTEKLWSYRMYYYPSDNIVRQGDIIKKRMSDEENLYLIVSSDCHMKEFWKKNTGYITFVPLHKISKVNSSLIRKLNYSSSNLQNLKPTSIVNISNINGPTIIPFLKTQDEISHYFIFPKSISSTYVELPERALPKKQLTYDELTDFDGEKRVCVSEPFKTPLIEHVLYSLTGYGAPDYPNLLQNHLNNIIKGILE